MCHPWSKFPSNKIEILVWSLGMYLHRDRNQIEVTVAGKVNLFLELLAKRSDGFHELEMFMATVSVFDTLRFRTLETPQLQFRCRWGAGLEAWGNSLRQQIATCELFGPLPKT